ncbi:MAG: hypothetical protein JXB39_16380, partial [Deltaproteobacteria bacterium]|nr:hypothetical protein [Deltaproteobacteria bacterium]
MLPAVWVPWLVLAFGPACVEPDTPPVETGEAYPAPGFPFPTRKGHQVVGDPEDHAERGQPSAWDLDCILEDGVGAVAGGTVVSVRDGLPSGEAYGDGNEVCIRQGSTRITFCHSRLQAGSLAELATGDVVMLGHRLGGCGASGR